MTDGNVSNLTLTSLLLQGSLRTVQLVKAVQVKGYPFVVTITMSGEDAGNLHAAAGGAYSKRLLLKCEQMNWISFFVTVTDTIVEGPQIKYGQSSSELKL